MASRSWNRVELIGNVTKDPELRYTPSGAAVCTFSIATNRTFVSDGEKKEETDFHRVVAWNKLAELCSQLIKKGNRVFVSGRLQNRSWETPEGQSRQMTEVVIEDMILLTSRQGGVTEEISETDVPSRSVEEMPRVQKSEVRSPASDSETPAESDKGAKAKEESAAAESDKEERSTKPAKAEVADSAKATPAIEDVGDLDDLPF